MFDLDQFIAIIARLGEPRRAEVQRLYNSEELTLLNVVWGPLMTIVPHNRLMWAVLGVYTGREDNIFWRRMSEDAGGKVEAAGAKSLGERDAEPLGRDVIHSVTNPLGTTDGCYPCLWWRLLFGGPQRMGIRKRCSNGTTTWRKICVCLSSERDLCQFVAQRGIQGSPAILAQPRLSC